MIVIVLGQSAFLNAVYSQMIGINTFEPEAMLHVEGKLQIADDTLTQQPGTIRFNADTREFEGWTGYQWRRFGGNTENWGNALTYERSSAGSSTLSDDDLLGQSAALSGRTLIVGASGDNVGGSSGQGRAFVYIYGDGVWTEASSFTGSGATSGDAFGSSVAIDGNYAIIGAPGQDVNGNIGQGAAYIFCRTGGVWTECALLTAPNGESEDAFGYAVAIRGDRVFVGAPLSSPEAQVYVFERSGTQWAQDTILTGLAGNDSDLFGASIASSECCLAIGAPHANFSAGLVYLFALNADSWEFEDTVSIFEPGELGLLGLSVTISDSTLFAGAPGKDDGTGGVYVFHRYLTEWISGQMISPSDPETLGQFGSAVDIHDGYLVIGAKGNKTGSPMVNGKAYLFQDINGTFHETTYLRPSDDALTEFGTTVCIQGYHLVVTAPRHDSGGRIYFFRRISFE